MQLRPNKSAVFPLLLCGAALLLILGSSRLYPAAVSGPVSGLLASGETSNNPGFYGEENSGDAQLASDVLNRWLNDSPGTATITVSRKEVVWILSLTDSAARQAKAKRATPAAPRSAVTATP